MRRKLIVVIYFVLILGLVLTSTAKSDLIGLWRFDETSGTIAHDASGNGHDGTIMGDPKWGAGKIGGGLEFDGTDDVVDLGAFDVVGRVSLSQPGLSRTTSTLTMAVSSPRRMNGAKTITGGCSVQLQRLAK